MLHTHTHLHDGQRDGTFCIGVGWRGMSWLCPPPHIIDKRQAKLHPLPSRSRRSAPDRDGRGGERGFLARNCRLVPVVEKCLIYYCTGLGSLRGHKSLPQWDQLLVWPVFQSRYLRLDRQKSALLVHCTRGCGLETQIYYLKWIILREKLICNRIISHHLPPPFILYY